MNNFGLAGLGAGISDGMDKIAEALVQSELQIKKLTNEMAKEKAYGSFQAYQETGDSKYLTDMLNNDKLKQFMPNVVRFDAVDYSKEENAKYKSLSEKDPSRFVTATNADGSQHVVDMYGAYARYGYIDKMREDKLKLMQTQAVEGQLKQQALEGSINSDALNNIINGEGSAEDKVIEMQKLLNPTVRLAETKQRAEQEKQQQERQKQLEADAYTKDLESYVYDNQGERFRADLDNTDVQTVTLGGKEVSKYKVAKDVQGKNKLPADARTYMDGVLSARNSMQKLYKKLANLDIPRDAWTKLQTEFVKVVGTDVKDYTEEQQRALLSKMEIDSELRTIMADYIKAMSGAGVSDEERKGYEQTILNGNWSNKSGALAAMSGFINGLNQSFSSKLLSSKADYPATYLDMSKLFNSTTEKLSEVPLFDAKDVKDTSKPSSVDGMVDKAKKLYKQAKDKVTGSTDNKFDDLWKDK